ncbi:MAG: glycine betaine ABC transporter substrate-binding protein [Desulfobacteraceae bacterium]|nr:glycine betaine ABC transporter substrate-binding protein [Desulfobacteraceae bacterium]
MIKAVLEEKLDYECNLRPVSAPALWQTTASGNADGFVCAWLPSLHRVYYAKAGDNVVDLGPNLGGTKVGLVVPKYVEINSIEQLRQHSEKFDNKIIGIDPGAGIMLATREAMDAYGLENMELVAGSGAVMTSVLGSKIDKGEWVVVTGWTPHWKFATWDLKYLKDPKNVFGGSEAIHTIVRKNLKTEKPELYEFLDNFYWELGDIHEVMAMIRQSGKPYETAVEWINKNPEKIEPWLPE